jgi:hypothetical protein
MAVERVRNRAQRVASASGLAGNGGGGGDGGGGGSSNSCHNSSSISSDLAAEVIAQLAEALPRLVVALEAGGAAGAG